MELIQYTPELRGQWNDFVKDSRNGTFLHHRDYMGYHGDRFRDSSLLFFDGGKLKGIFPAAVVDNNLVSHPGLTFGGLIISRKAISSQIEKMLNLIVSFCKGRGYDKLVYTPSPFPYHTLPTEEDIYFLFHRHHAIVSAMWLDSVIDIAQQPSRFNIRKEGIRRACELGLKVVESTDFSSFHSLLSHNLRERYCAVPVHSLEEIVSLAKLFPEQIRLFSVSSSNGEMIAAVLVYVSRHIVKTQYIASNNEGREKHALDLLISTLIDKTFSDKRYFDLGTSNEQNGTLLNNNLIYQKEGFGARGVAVSRYEVVIGQNISTPDILS